MTRFGDSLAVGLRFSGIALRFSAIGALVAQPARSSARNMRCMLGPRFEEVVSSRIRDARLRAGTGAGPRGCDAAGGPDALHARDIAEVALASDRSGAEQEPGNRAWSRRVGAAPHGADDPAAITRGFPLRAGVVAADAIAMRIEQLGLGCDENPFLVAALVDLNALSSQDAFQRFAGRRLQALRHAARAAGKEQYKKHALHGFPPLVIDVLRGRR